MDYTCYLQDAIDRADALGALEVPGKDWLDAIVIEAEMLASLNLEPNFDIPSSSPYQPLQF